MQQLQCMERAFVRGSLGNCPGGSRCNRCISDAAPHMTSRGHGPMCVFENSLPAHAEVLLNSYLSTASQYSW